MKVLAALLTLAILAQQPPPTPDDLTLAVKYALALFVAWAAIMHGCNQTREFWQGIRGKNGRPRLLREVTREELQEELVALGDAAAQVNKQQDKRMDAHSDRFKEQDKRNEVQRTNQELVVRHLIRLNTALRLNGVDIPYDRVLDGDK